AVPADFDLAMTYTRPKSAYYFPARAFNDQVIEQFNAGSLFFGYMGHGFARGFDQIRDGEERHRILSVDDLRRLKSGSRSPVVAILACSTAHFDDPSEDCIAELMLREPGGPIAVIGGTRITHPLPNALLGESLITRFFDTDLSRVGEVVASSRRALHEGSTKNLLGPLAAAIMGPIDQERLLRDHDHLYVLLGDPAMRIARPELTLDLKAPDEARAGTTIRIECRLPEAFSTDEVELSLEVPRSEFATPLSESGSNDPESAKRRHARANDKALWRRKVPVTDGAFTFEAPIPREARAGTLWIKVWAKNDTLTAIGARRLTVTTD
ncbi:MAG: hypothetical protein KDB53_07245, partial [Planctomycetes bacterium]|nr:hypothetical protein [Planctomycetota bacterium]